MATVIGKHIIDTLTSGMYDDCRFVFREYIQNSADAIDEAVRTGLFKSPKNGNIYININENKKKIIIEDDATGIPKNEFVGILKNIADSTKDKDKNKGFRGIGRLGGLGYCQKLIFESSYVNESIKCKLIWDASKLRSILNDKHVKMEASNLIDAITEYKEELEDPGKHYFKVILEDITADELLEKNNISEYLSMVAPVPYHKRFIFADKIYSELKNIHLSINEYNIFLNDDQVTKAYTTSIYESNGGIKKIDELIDVEFFYFDYEDEPLIWGWFGISSFTKQIPESSNIARGIRLRKYNIQIGDDSAINHLHKEKRGNYYFFGEIHAFHKKLIPNGRRDYFEYNDACKYFEENIKKLFYERLYRLYYLGSRVRSINNEINKYVEVKDVYDQKSKKGFISKNEKSELEIKLEKSKDYAEKANNNLKNYKKKFPDVNLPERKIIDKIAKNIPNKIPDAVIINNSEKKIPFITDDLNKLSHKEKKLLSDIFVVISNVLSKDLADNLINKIKEKLK